MKITGCRFIIAYVNILLLPSLFFCEKTFGQTPVNQVDIHTWAMTNVDGRKKTSLNGKWEAIIDSYDAGKNRGYWKDAHATGKSDFYEYDFKGGITLNVPGDFNSQLPELKYYESTVWYKRSFNYSKTNNRVFVHFGAVN